MVQRFPHSPPPIHALAHRSRWYNRQSDYGGYSSAAERLTVAQDVVGSIPTSRPTLQGNLAFHNPTHLVIQAL